LGVKKLGLAFCMPGVFGVIFPDGKPLKPYVLVLLRPPPHDLAVGQTSGKALLLLPNTWFRLTKGSGFAH
jgi:hypothetical protein